MEHYLVSARKYRPTTFDSVVGQKALTATLKNAIATRRLAHSYLFCGSRGVGKTSCARIFAKTINCEHPTPDGEACNECESCRSFNEGRSLNIIEMDAASNNSVDYMRALVEQVMIPPVNGKYRVFIIDEVHMLSNAAFNAFLKTLEEPPAHAIFILATTEKHKIIPTILSRCQIYDFNTISIRDMVDHLRHVAEKEGMTAETSALGIIARKADGAMRDALSIFDQVAASTRGNLTYQATLENLNVLDHSFYNRLVEAMLAGDAMQTWLIYKEIRDNGFDSHFFLNGLAAYMRDLMVARDPATASLLDADEETTASIAAVARKCSPEFLFKAMSLLGDADLNYRTASNKQFLVELTLARLCQQAGPSANDGDNAEGQLKPISRPAPAPTPAASQPQPQPQPQTQPIKTEPQPVVNVAAPRPLRPGPQPRQTIRASAPTIHKRPEEKAQVETQVRASLNRNNTFSDDDFLRAWHAAAAKADPAAHILINTIRSSKPTRRDQNTFTVAVDAEVQRSTLLAAMDNLRAFIADQLENDFINIVVELNQGETKPATWSDREVLQKMLEDNPDMKSFIEYYKLSLG